MNVLYTCDNNYVWLMGISVISLFENNKCMKNLDVYLLGDKITDENKKKLAQIASNYDRKIIVIDVPELNIPSSLISARWPISAFTRLFSGMLLPANVNSILYLDCDTIICGDISELSKIEFEDKIVYGVLDCISGLYKSNIGLDKNDIYINAGVLLINIEALRKINIKDEIDAYMKEYVEFINYADQDILNGMMRGKIGVLKPQFDVMTIDAVYSYDEIVTLRKPTSFYSAEELENGVKDKRIIHYTTNMRVVRPWYINTNHPFSNEFKKYMSLSSWRNRELNKMTFKSKEAKIIGIIELLPSKVAYKILGLIHTEIKPWYIKVRAKRGEK